MLDDKVLYALEQYNDKATSEQKEADLDKLEKECLSVVDAYKYVKQPDLKITNNEILCAANEYFKQHRKDNSFNAFKSGAAWMYYRLIDKAGRDNFQKEAYKTGQLTLDDAIKHCEDMEQIMETEAVREEHRLLKNWLIELKNYRETSNDKN